ncbi:hypothetical protein Dimus_006157 [Dionaea muscipula]
MEGVKYTSDKVEVAIKSVMSNRGGATSVASNALNESIANPDGQMKILDPNISQTKGRKKDAKAKDKIRRMMTTMTWMKILTVVMNVKAYFVDLFVRASNIPAIKMYEKLGYVVYRSYLFCCSQFGYSGEEDGLDKRKALS